MRHSSQASLLLPHHGPPSPAFLTLHHISFSVSGSGYPSSPRTQPAQGRAELARSAAGSSIFTLGWGGGWQNSSLTSHSHLWHQAEMWHSQLCICMILCACRELCPRVETAAGVTVWSTSKKLPPATQHRLHQTHLSLLHAAGPCLWCALPGTCPINPKGQHLPLAQTEALRG